jgi:hypothetical protein
MEARWTDKIDELVATLESTIRLEAERLGSCGAVDLDDYSPDEYLLAKLLVTAAARKHCNDFAPFTKAGKRELKNLESF